MTDAQKLFTCTSPDCNMSFADEDHLALHRKKHEMLLNLEHNGKSSGFVADQTPTPTRFIRNCEEVGLFQDLQNVNPFEETFRRAVEARNTGTLAVSSEVESTDDTLHTPHIFPHIADVLSDGTHILSETSQECSTPMAVAEESTSKVKSSVETQTCSDLNLHLSESHLIKDGALTSTKTTSLHAESIVLQHLNVSVSPKKTQLQSSSKLSINGEEVELLLKTADGKLMQLSAMPISEPPTVSCLSPSQISSVGHTRQQSVLVRSELPQNVVPILEAKKALPSRMTIAKMKLQQVLAKKVSLVNDKSPEAATKRAIPGHSSRKGNNQRHQHQHQQHGIDQHKKKELLERNRASSMRARAKRKAWIQHLQKTVTNVNENNAALQLEVKSLRSEVARLKTLLQAHKYCPVTKEMQKGNGVLLGAKIVGLSPNSDDATDQSGAQSVKTLTAAFAPYGSRKKLASAGVTKNPVILPKVERVASTTPIISNATIVKNIPAIKLMNVAHFMAEKDEVKQQQIMIVPNAMKRSEEAPQRRKIIRLNPNYEIKLASSKTTSA